MARSCENCTKPLAEGDLAWKWQPMRVVDGDLVGVITVDEQTCSTKVIGDPVDGCTECTPARHPDEPDEVKAEDDA